MPDTTHSERIDFLSKFLLSEGNLQKSVGLTLTSVKPGCRSDRKCYRRTK